MASAKQDEFTGMLMALQGVTVLEAPRVSRETIIDTLRDHTLIMREMKKNVVGLTGMVTQLANEANENKRIIQNLQDDNKKIRVDVETLYRLSDEFRTEMNELGEKVAELYVLKAQMKEFRAFVDEFHHRFERHAEEMTEYQALTNRTIATLDNKANDTLFQLKELKDYVDHFGDNLILPSSQITVEASAGYDTRPKSLLEILKLSNGQMLDVQESLSTHTAQISASEAEIRTKADEGVIHEVKGLQRKVASIENHILKDEEQGVGAMRRTVEDLVDKMQGMTTDMNEKMDRREVSFVVHEKYEEIVKYLQDALQSSTEDEMNFKAKADEIQQLITTLNNTKADRVEIAPMQEILVKTESMLKKLGGDKKGGGKDGTMTRKEIEALLELKVDKADLEHTLSGIAKGNRKNKRLAALGGVSSHVIDEALPIEDANAVARDKAMWKSLSDAMQDESDELILRAAQKAQAAGESSDFSAYMLSKKAQAAGNRGTMSPNPAGTPGSFRPPSENGRAGPQSRPGSNSGYAAAYGQPGGPSFPTSQDLNRSVTSMTDYAGGKVEYPHVPPTASNQAGEHVQDMSFLGGKMAGGGFNERNNTSLRTGPLRALGSPVEDVDGIGMMVRGDDGKFYMTDSSPATSPTAAASNKKLDLLPRQ